MESVWRLRRGHENRRIDESHDGDLALPRPHPASASPGGAYAPSPTLRVSSLRRTRMPACAGHEQARTAVNRVAILSDEQHD